MVLVDTSVWISHFRNSNRELISLLHNEFVLSHPFIVGEIACGNLKNRGEILSLLLSLPMAALAEFDEILHFIESNKLMGIGIGYIDVHLLASARLTRALLWTDDNKLKESAQRLDISYKYQ